MIGSLPISGGFSSTKQTSVQGGRNDANFGDVRTGGLRVGGFDFDEMLPVLALLGAVALAGLYIWKKV